MCQLIALVASFLVAMSAAAAPDGQWFPIGPADIENGQTYGFANGGAGRVNASGRATIIAVNPNNPKDVWLGTATGGVWYSTNASEPGIKWRPMTDALNSLSIGALALADCNATRCNTVYIGTGENNIRRHTYYGTGLYVGRFGTGEFEIYSFNPLGTSAAAFTGGAINNIVLDGSDIFVTVSVGRASSASQSTVESPPPRDGYGVHVSSDDGASWSLVAASPENALPTDLVKSPAGELYAGFMAHGLFKLSTSGDTWCPLHPGNTVPAGCADPATTGLPTAGVEGAEFDHVELEWSPADPEVAYLVLGKCPSTVAESCIPNFFRTSDGGTTWSALPANTDDGSISTFSRYTHGLNAHPIDANTITYSGIKLWQSNDGGNLFRELGSPEIHPDHHDFVYPDLANLSLVYATTDGGFYYSLNGGDNWSSGNYDLQTVQFYSVAADTEQETGSLPTGSVIGGTQDNGVNMFVGSRSWPHVLDGDGGDTSMQDGQTMFGSTQRIGTAFSTTGGTLGSWNFEEDGLSGPTAFYPPYFQHPVSKNLYFAGDQVFRRSVSDTSWTVISPEFDPSPTEYPLIETKNVISALAVSRNSENRLYVGHYNGALWRSRSGDPCADLSCWEEIGGPNVSGDGLPNAVISSIDVHPTNPDRVYVTYSGFNLPGERYVYTNGAGGVGTWQNFSQGLPDLPANVIKVDPDSPTELWLGSDRGVYKRTSGTNWEAFGPSSGMPNVPVYDMAIDNFRGRVYAATFGRGMFMLTNNPAIYTFEGWMDGEIWDVLLYGDGWSFAGGATMCTVRLIRRDGTVCASGTTDSYSGTTISVGPDGALVTDRQFVWEDRPVIAACLNGKCVGDTNISACLTPGNELSSVLVECGGQVATARISEECPQQENPPSTVLDVNATPPGSGGRRRNGAMAAGSFDVIATTTSTAAIHGGDRAICGARVSYPAGATPVDIGDAMIDTINNAPSCNTAGVSALRPRLGPPAAPADQPGREEDAPTAVSGIRLDAPSLTGGQLMLGFRAAPGVADNMCFQVSSLGIPALNQLALVQKRITTDVGGAAGGSITISQSSGVGRCQITVTTFAGETGAQIAQRISDAFMNMTAPGTHTCDARQNAYDMIADGDKLISVSSTRLEICVDDENVGLEVGPVDVNLRDFPVDGGTGDIADPLPFRDPPGLVVSGHVGATIPIGSFGNVVSSGLALGLDVEYAWRSRTTLLGYLRHQRFDELDRSDFTYTSVSVNVRRYYPISNWNWFGQVGLGYYFANRGSDDFGINVGVGAHLPLSSSRQALELGVDLHWIDASGSDRLFLSPGVALKFKF